MSATRSPAGRRMTRRQWERLSDSERTKRAWMSLSSRSRTLIIHELFFLFVGARARWPRIRAQDVLERAEQDGVSLGDLLEEGRMRYGYEALMLRSVLCLSDEQIEQRLAPKYGTASDWAPF